ncbi:MAG: hypothetical protein VX090_14810, partial [Pseudomonadota bacterium]|nr:hypothetical protein [Pseudomonadota bacterium]
DQAAALIAVLPRCVITAHKTEIPVEKKYARYFDWVSVAIRCQGSPSSVICRSVPLTPEA